jgi:hypothetical protein
MEPDTAQLTWSNAYASAKRLREHLAARHSYELDSLPVDLADMKALHDWDHETGAMGEPHYHRGSPW